MKTAMTWAKQKTLCDACGKKNKLWRECNLCPECREKRLRECQEHYWAMSGCKM